MKHLKRWVIHRLLRSLFNVVESDDILGRDKQGNWYVGTDKLTREDILSLQTEANTLKETKLYKLLMKRTRYLAYDAIYNKSTTEEDLLFPKAMLKWTQEIEDTVNKLS
jgi:hypothetical protein